MKAKLFRIIAVVITLSTIGYMGISLSNVNAAAVADSTASVHGLSTGGMGVHKGVSIKDTSASSESESSSGGGGGGSTGSGDYDTGSGDYTTTSPTTNNTTSGGCCS